MKQEAKSATSAPTTLWDRTRQLASQEILETALRLFIEQGYDETTIAQIAREAGVSQRTLFRYFGTKEDLLGGGQDQFGQVLMDTISEQPADAGIWEALRAGVAAVLALHDSREQALERFRLLHNTASLRAGWLEKRLRFQENLLPLIETRMDAAALQRGCEGPRGDRDGVRMPGCRIDDVGRQRRQERNHGPVRRVPGCGARLTRSGRPAREPWTETGHTRCHRPVPHLDLPAGFRWATLASCATRWHVRSATWTPHVECSSQPPKDFRSRPLTTLGAISAPGSAWRSGALRNQDAAEAE